MRRLLLLTVLACLIAPAPAHAGGFVIDFSGMHVGVHVYAFQNCPEESCGGLSLPVALEIERAGSIVATSAPARDAWVNMTLVHGDVVHVLHEGVEQAAIPYEPAGFDAACAPRDARTLSGTFQHGEAVGRAFEAETPGMLRVDDHTSLRVFLGSEADEAAATLSADGDRWQVRLSRPAGDVSFVNVLNAYRRSTPVGPATVWSWLLVDDCLPPLPELPTGPPPPLPPAAAPCTAASLLAAPEAGAAFRAAVRTLRLRPLRRGRAALGGLAACPGARVSVRVATTGRRAVVVAKGRATWADAPLALVPTRRAARLAGRRRAAVRVTLRLTDAAGGTAAWTRRATLSRR